MIEKRFTISQNGTFHTVKDNVENKPMGVFEFKDDEFPVYACFHGIIDLMNDLNDENEQLKQQIKDLYKFVKYDVDNKRDVYPKSILEHLVNILKIIGDVE